MSVAIRAITRIQDADDINVSLGVGVDEYALCWDNDTAKFVLRAPAAAPDLSGYALLAGRAGGQVLYGGTGANDDITIEPTSHGTKTTADLILANAGGRIVLADTTTALTGVIYKGADRFLHNFHHPTGQTTPPTGYNTFVGVNAGNLTTGSTATNANEASYNTAVGTSALPVVTLGRSNVAIGAQSLLANTIGQHNVALGWTTLPQNTIGAYNMGVGTQALYGVVDTSGNVGIGYQAGRYRGSGTTEMTGEQYSVYIGYQARGYSDTDNNSVVIGGNRPIGLGANTTVIGNTSTTAATIYGAGLHNLTDATTNAIVPMLTLTKNVTGADVGAAGLGAAVLFTMETSTTVDTSAASVQAIIYEATHVTRKFDLVLNAYDTAIREGLRIRGNGSAPAIGFLGAAPQARIAHVADPSGGGTVDTEARSAINSILATLEGFGFHATS